MEAVRENEPGVRSEHAQIMWHMRHGRNLYVGNFTTIGQVDNPTQLSSPSLPVVIGRNVSIGNCCSISEGVNIGDGVKIGNNVVIRSGVILDDRCRVGHGTVFEGDAEIGKDTLIHAQCHITKGVKIGHKVFIAPFFCGANDPRCLRRDLRGEEFVPEGYIICNGARVGIGVRVLPGVVIGENAQVGAHSLVTHDVEPGTLVMGVPARVCRNVPRDEWIGGK